MIHFVVFGIDVLKAFEFERIHHKIILFDVAFCDGDDAFALEHKGYATVRSHRTAEFVEQVTNVTRRTIFIVGEGFDDNGSSANTVTLVNHIFIVD